MYEIRFVGDDELPEGHDFVFAHSGSSALIVYRESAVTPEVLMQSWAAYRATLGRQPREPMSERGGSVRIPDQRLERSHRLAATFHVA